MLDHLDTHWLTRLRARNPGTWEVVLADNENNAKGKEKQKLTKKVVDRAPLPERREGEDDDAYQKRRRWLGDLEISGFGLKTYGNGRRVYALRYRTPTGRQRMYTLGEHGALTADQPRDEAAVKKVEVLQGSDPQREKQRKKVQLPTVNKLLDQWLDDYAKTHRTRWPEDERRLKKHVRPKLGSLSLEDLTRDVVAAWHRKAGKGAPVEANRAMETLRAAWRWADREGVLPPGLEDPTRSVKKFKERSRDRWLKKEEVKRLMKVAEAEDIQAAIRLFLLSSSRACGRASSLEHVGSMWIWSAASCASLRRNPGSHRCASFPPPRSGSYGSWLARRRAPSCSRPRTTRRSRATISSAPGHGSERTPTCSMSPFMTSDVPPAPTWLRPACPCRSSVRCSDIPIRA